ncbi:MAG: Hsp20/alpha crystallin family protein [Myxococcales bacterium]|nr:Hsp20/alpha crystallin family protein [Myxococcales bacterium]
MAQRGELVRREERGEAIPVRHEWDPFRRMREMMREMISWDPFQEMARIWPEARAGGFLPAFDVRETDDSFVFRADVPGIREDNLDVTLTGNRLTISGKRELEEAKETDRYYSCECRYGDFSRSFTLPEGVDAENVRSEIKDGVLTLILPKKPEVQARHIAVKGTAAGRAKA